MKNLCVSDAENRSKEMSEIEQIACRASVIGISSNY